jgi:hypothetical protein
MVKACSTNGRRGMHIGYWWKNHKERDHYKPTPRWVDYIKMNLKGVRMRWDGLDRSGSG